MRFQKALRRAGAHKLGPVALAAGLALGAGAAAAADRAIIVLDASGSMWGQIGGEAKITIARQTLSRVLGRLPAELELGLIAYGHREKGVCTDIELMVPAGPGTAAAITDAVNALKPKGKTPLTDAVRQAAEALKYTEDKATVILITDGLETCDADPCALGRMLEETGVDFTAHVVGFGLSEKDGREVACLATETGGVYLSAGDAGELVDALDQTVAQAPAPEPEPEPEPELPTATLTAPDAVPAASTFAVDWEGPGGKADEVRLFDPNALNGEGRRVRAARIPDDNGGTGTESLVAPARTGTYELQYWNRVAKAILATRSIEVTEIDVRLDHDEAVEGGATFTVGWKGPGARYDEIQLFDPSALNGEGKFVRGKRISVNNDGTGGVELVAPVKPGDYEIRYWNGDNKTVLASSPLVVTEVAASVTFDSPADAGSTLTVTWDGPGGRYDEIYIFDPGAKGGDGATFKSTRVRNGDFDNKTVKLPVPAKPGSYEVRYWNGDNKTDLASAPLEVSEVDVSLTFDSPASAGSTLTIAWDGPGARYDEVYIFDPRAKGGEGATFRSTRVRNGDFDNKTVKLVVPVEPGDYEVRYWNGDSKTDMASAPLTVTEVAVGLDFPAQVPAGSTMTITWEGPGARYDEVYIFDPRAKGGEGATFRSTRVRNGDFDNKSVKLVVPVEPGDYEVRYWNGDSKTDMASAPLTVTEVAVGLDFPAQVPAGSTVTITWEGPGARYDEVYIFDPRAKGGEGATFRSTRVRNGDFDNKSVKLVVPVEPGDYEVRYWNGDSKTDMASAPLTVTEIAVGLDFPAQVPAGSTVTITWEGPGARYDEVYIYDPRAKGGDGATFKSTRVRNGDFDNKSVKLNVPIKPGAYEVRYWNGDSKTDLVSEPLTVTEIEVGLEAPEAVEVETRFGVVWTGPGARYDEVQIVNSAGKKVSSRRVRNDDFENNKVTIKAPKEPGEYTLRYWNGDNKAVLVEQPLSVN